MNGAALLEAIRSGAPATPQLVNSYYTHCIAFYREFLGAHWHTGFYLPERDSGPEDQLRMERLVADSAAIDAACTVLDVGCGIGGVACHLAGVTGARFRGLTPNPEQLRLAQETQARLGLRNVAFDLGEASHLPYPDASFDVVLFFESACHFPDRARFFAEAWRVLKPGGRLAGEDWLASEGAPRLDRVCQTWAIPALDTVSGYARLMREAGFVVPLACDMRGEMDLLRGFMATAEQRAEVASEMARSADPVRRLIMEGLLALGEAAERGDFTVGRFVAVKARQP